MDWKQLTKKARKGDSPAARVYNGMRHILTRRKDTPELHRANPTVVVDTGHPKLFAFVRETPANATLCLFNFTEDRTRVSGDWARSLGVRDFHDAPSDAEVELDEGWILLPPYARVWLRWSFSRESPAYL